MWGGRVGKAKRLQVAAMGDDERWAAAFGVYQKTIVQNMEIETLSKKRAFVFLGWGWVWWG